MKFKNTIIGSFATLILLHTFVNHLNAQSDSTEISYSVESIEQSDFKYKRQYQYLNIAQKNERFLLKAGFSALKYNYNFFLGYEVKLTKSLSFIYELTNEASSPDSRFGCRYFFLMKNQIKNGLSGNNLNGVYVGARINPTHFQEEQNSSFILADLALGYQKRLNWFSYIDASLYVSTVDYPYRENYGVVFGFSGKVGLAWGWNW